LATEVAQATDSTIEVIESPEIMNKNWNHLSEQERKALEAGRDIADYRQPSEDGEASQM